MQRVTIYTDGGCTGNPGPGGWGAVILSSEEIQLSGGEASTTNNRMELTAAIKSLEYVHRNFENVTDVELYTDSQYVKNGINSWMVNWKKNGWKTAAKKPVKNQDLWIELDRINQLLNVNWKWVKGHSGNTYNEMCDTLVAEERARFE